MKQGGPCPPYVGFNDTPSKVADEGSSIPALYTVGTGSYSFESWAEREHNKAGVPHSRAGVPQQGVEHAVPYNKEKKSAGW